MFKPTDKYDVEVKKKGRRAIGDLLTFKSGVKAYVFPFSQSDMYLINEKNISQALRKDKACLWVETTKFDELKRNGVQVVGFRIRQTGDIYMTNIEKFANRDLITVARVGRNIVKALPISEFRIRQGQINL